jgi:cell wall-associated NlpC family hydrolase
MSGWPVGWARGYAGIPYRDGGRDRTGCDCWGLIRLVYAEVLGAALPDYTYATAEDRAEVLGLIDGDRRRLWREVPQAEAVAGDVALLRYADGTPGHMGVMVDAKTMLHVHRGIDATVTPLRRRYLGVVWQERMEAVGRWQG